MASQLRGVYFEEGAKDDFDEEERREKIPFCVYASAISTADEQLDAFQGEAAAKNYQIAIDYAEAASAEVIRKDGLEIGVRFNACRPTYGKMLAEIQKLLHFVNSVVEEPAGKLLSGEYEDLLATLGGAAGLVPTQIDFDYEFGQNILNLYAESMKQSFDEIARLHNVLETMPDCEFIATNNHALAFNPRAFVSPGLPLRLLNNRALNDPRLLNDASSIALEIRMGLRWDAAEARIVRFAVEVIRALLFSLIAHDLTIDEEQVLQASDWLLDVLNQGSNLLDLAECNVPLLSSPFTGARFEPCSIEDALYSANPDPVRNNCVVDTPEECQLYVAQTIEGFSLAHYIRRLGFVMDNPKTFARHETRWTPYISQVDNSLAAAFAGASDLVEGMVQRSVRYAGDVATDERLAEFSFLFEDNNEDGILNRGDKIGFQVQPDIKIKLPDKLLADLGLSEDDLDSIIELLNVFLPQVLQQTIPDDDYVQALQSSVEILRDQFASVDATAAVETEPFVLASLQPVITASFLFGEEPVPNSIAFDFGAGLRASSEPTDMSPVPLRDLLPYVTMILGYTPAGGAVPVNEFIIEEELRADANPTFDFSWQTTGVAPWNNGDVPHFGNGGSDYTAFNPKAEGCQANLPDVDVDPDCLYTVPRPEPTLEADCDAPENQPPSDLFANVLDIDQGIMYFYLPDPSFNGALLTFIGDGSGITTCPGDNGRPGRNGFEPADLYTFHRSFIKLAAWWNENFTISDLLDALGGVSP